MKQKRGNQGLAFIIIVSILALLVIVGGIVVWRLQKPVVPQKEEQQISLLTPEKVTENFYKWYIDCREKYDCPRETNGEVIYEKSGYASDKLAHSIGKTRGVDPILCAQDIPRGITVGNSDIAGENASLTVTEDFQPPVSIKVDLKLLNNHWVITNVSCSE